MSAYAAAIRKAQVDALLDWLARSGNDVAEGARLARDGLEGELRRDGVPLDDHQAVVRGAFRALLDADVLPIGVRSDVELLLKGASSTSSRPGADYAARVSKSQVDALLVWLADGAGDLVEGAQIASSGHEAALQQAGVPLGDSAAVVRHVFEALSEADVVPIAAREDVDRLVADLRGTGPSPQPASAPPSTPLGASAPPPHHTVAPVGKGVDLLGSGWLPWWRRIGTEQPQVSERCEVTGCPSQLSPVDICCPIQGHDDILPGQGWPKRRRFWIVNSARTTAAMLVLASAARETIWPIYGLAIALGCVVVGLFLRAHRAGRFIALGGLGGIMVAVGTVVALGIDDDRPRLVGTVVTGLPLMVGALLLVVTVRFVTKDLTEVIEREAICTVVTSLVLALLAALAWWATTGSYARWFVDVPPSTSTWLLLWGTGAAAATLAAAVVGALLLSRGEINVHVVPLIQQLPQAWIVPWRYDVPDLVPRAKMSVGVSLAWHVSRAGHKLTKAVVDVTRQTLQQLLRVEAALRRVVCRTINRAHRRLVLIGRRASFVARRWRSTYAEALRHGARAAAYTGRPLGAYAAAVGVSVAALHLAVAYTDYLLDGSLHSLASGAGWTLLGLVLCVIIVERLASASDHDVSLAMRRFAYVGGVDVSMVVVVSGLALGLPGTFGPGPIHVGWVSIGGLVLWVSLMAVAWSGRRRMLGASD